MPSPSKSPARAAACRSSSADRAVDPHRRRAGRREVDGPAAAAPEHDVDRPGVEPPARVRPRRADEQVVEAVPVDVARRLHVAARVVGGSRTDDQHPAGPERRQVDRPGRRTPEDHPRDAAPGVVVAVRAGDQVVDPVAVDVAGRRQRLADLVLLDDPVDLDVGLRQQVDRPGLLREAAQTPPGRTRARSS